MRAIAELARLGAAVLQRRRERVESSRAIALGVEGAGAQQQTGAMFPVWVRVDGGNGGSGWPTLCSFTYKAWPMLGIDELPNDFTPALGEGLVPRWNASGGRVTGVIYTYEPGELKIGQGFYDRFAEFVLYSVPETANVSVCGCPPEGGG